MPNVAAVRRSLEASAAEIAALPPEGYAAAASSFKTLMTGVNQAANGLELSLEELLGELEPKGRVLEFLVALHRERRIYRRQISAVLSVLLQVASWTAALREHQGLYEGLPEDLRAVADDALASSSMAADEEPPEADPPPEAAAPPCGDIEAEQGPAAAAAAAAAAPLDSAGVVDQGRPSKSLPSEDEVQAAIARARAEVAAKAAAKQVTQEDPLALLWEGKNRIEALMAQDLGPFVDIDEALTAFEVFQRAVRKVAAGLSGSDRASLDDVEPKVTIIDFLVEFNEKKRKYSSRILSLLSCLLHFDSWSAAVDQDPAIQAKVLGLKGGCHAVTPSAPLAEPPSPPAATTTAEDDEDSEAASEAESSTESEPELGEAAAAEAELGEAEEAEATPEPRERLSSQDKRALILARAKCVLDLDAVQETAQGLLCPAGHAVTKRKNGLRWHQLAEFWNSRTCDVCGEEISKAATRWRCHEHCNFDVCEACHEDAAQGRLHEKDGGGSPLKGRVRVAMPQDGMKEENGVHYLAIDVVPQGGTAWRVLRSSSEFNALAESLSPKALAWPDAPFPRRTSQAFTGKQLDERRVQLSVWLQKAVLQASNVPSWRKTLHAFLEVQTEAHPHEVEDMSL